MKFTFEQIVTGYALRMEPENAAEMCQLAELQQRMNSYGVPGQADSLHRVTSITVPILTEFDKIP